MANAVTGNRYEEGGGGNGGGGGGGGRPPRLPRWTRQEILVLIQGKKVAESRGRGGRAGSRAHHMGAAAGGLVGVGSPVEPKWATVSSYCRRHGVNRGPVQCRKRWSNLASDYKKIKEWERRKGGEESFWVMRNDLRRERRLPGFFDREVYDILDGTTEPEPEEEDDESWRKGGTVEPPRASGATAATAGDEEEEDAAAVFDSGRTAAEDGLFSDSEQEQDEGAEEEDKEEERPGATAPAPPTLATPISGMASEKQQPEENPEKASSSREGHKRRRTSSGEDGEEDNMQTQLMEVLERNSRTLMAHLEAQNTNCQLDREQRKEHADSLVGVLSRVADALARIADKL
ncbi:hypothetical protein Taro_044012 [Colocasia esculenta]|uniref:Myb/SANT-like DNA-binding domain-containing protein n=1 Tax=Colocasia esculenta TaxID=4460 RepID=A0A843X2L6_COLES|nr:hypothetical protein [Colocasia esculenta]